ncbi:hypothetical protein EMCRGX_G013068 [Ephydatia muelleri]
MEASSYPNWSQLENVSLPIRLPDLVLIFAPVLLVQLLIGLVSNLFLIALLVKASSVNGQNNVNIYLYSVAVNSLLSLLPALTLLISTVTKTWVLGQTEMDTPDAFNHLFECHMSSPLHSSVTVQPSSLQCHMSSPLQLPVSSSAPVSHVQPSSLRVTCPALFTPVSQSSPLHSSVTVQPSSLQCHSPALFSSHVLFSSSVKPTQQYAR